MMWGKNPTAPKCPRNDCEHYDCKQDEAPCSQCSCNRGSGSYGRTFNYKHKEEEQVCEKNFQPKPSMPGSST